MTDAAAPSRACELDLLWEAYRAAIVVRFKVKTPEVEQEVQRARDALLNAMERPDTS